MTNLRRRMIQDMQLRGLTPGTQRAYIEGVKALAAFYHRPPDQLTEHDVRHFFLHLITTGRLAQTTVSLYFYATKFLFCRTLARQWPLFDLMRFKRTRPHPVILAFEEVRRLLAHIRRPAARMAAVMMYSCGLRVSEAVALRAEHIDSARMVVCVRGGKGGKDRDVLLPTRTLELLRAYWRRHRPGRWLLPSATGHSHISPNAVRKCIKAACIDAGIAKKVSCHTLRHSTTSSTSRRRIKVATGLLAEPVAMSALGGSVMWPGGHA
ncbi:site-specific integrase [bacterium]|nr:site-specific integrase [bacterium]